MNDPHAAVVPPPPTTWDRPGLEARGFVGFIPLIGLDVVSLPPTRGMYAVLRDPTVNPVFLTTNPITRRPPYVVERLRDKIERLGEQSIVYLGKADPADGIRGRLGALSRKSSAHTGGRALWQLADTENLLATWHETPHRLSAEMETEWLGAFKEAHGDYPFANWRG